MILFVLLLIELIELLFAVHVVVELVFVQQRFIAKRLVLVFLKDLLPVKVFARLLSILVIPKAGKQVQTLLRVFVGR